MSSRKRANIVEEESSSSDSEPEEGYKGNEEIQVDFEGRNPIASDFHGIRQLLQQLFLKAEINLSELTDIIIDQSFVGSVVIQSDYDEEEDDTDDEDFDSTGTIFGITTAINISANCPNGCQKQLRAYLLDKAEKSSDTVIANILKDESKSVGLIINERFVNIPPQIAVPLLESLQKEVQRAATKRPAFQFDYYLMIVKLYRKEDKKAPEDFYSNGEEEIMFENAASNFEYSVQSETDSGLSGNWLESDSKLIPYRKIILFEANHLQPIVNSIKEHIN